MTGISIAVATGNQHKLQEIAAILGLPLESMYSSRSFAGFEDPAEDGQTFEDNAGIKARALAHFIKSKHPDHEFWLSSGPKWVIADDSGLEVDALGGKPGIHSARFASDELGIEGNSPDSSNNEKLVRLLKETPDGNRQARFVCVIAAISALDTELAVTTFRGHCPGRISDSPSGSHGFGYDPLFIPGGYKLSLAELGEEIKSKISHRSKALEGLKSHLAAAI